MKNLVIVGISDTADRIARFVERYSLYNIIGCTVNSLKKNNEKNYDYRCYWVLRLIYSNRLKK